MLKLHQRNSANVSKTYELFLMPSAFVWCAVSHITVPYVFDAPVKKIQNCVFYLYQYILHSFWKIIYKSKIPTIFCNYCTEYVILFVICVSCHFLCHQCLFDKSLTISYLIFSQLFLNKRFSMTLNLCNFLHTNAIYVNMCDNYNVITCY